MTNTKKRVSFVILSYNRQHELLKTIEVIKCSDVHISEIIVVDNASTDGTQEVLTRAHPDVVLIRKTANVGIAGWNDGFERCTSPYVFVLDDDSRPVGDAVEKCTEVMEREARCAIVACSIVSPSRSGVNQPSVTRMNAPDFIGCGALIRLSVIRELGGYDCNIFLYAHEMEFSMRVLDLGYYVINEPHALVEHNESPVNRELRGSVSRRLIYHGNRSAFYLLASRFPIREVLLRLIRMLLGRLLFASTHGAPLTAVRGIHSGLMAAYRARNTTKLISKSTRASFGNGSCLGGFFGPRGLAFQRRPDAST